MFTVKLFSIILLYGYFDFALGTPSELVNWYRNNVFEKNENEKKHVVCHQNLFEWTNHCQNVYALLRNESAYYNWLFADYFALIRRGKPKCEKVNLVLSTGETVSQYVLPCIGSSLVVSANSQSSSATYVTDVAIYPADNDTSVMILKEIQNLDDSDDDSNVDDTPASRSVGTNKKTKNYYLWGRYENFNKWHTVGNVQEILFSHPRPRSTELFNVLKDTNTISEEWKKIYDRKKNSNSILNHVDIRGFLKLCSWVYGQKKYWQEFFGGSTSDASKSMIQRLSFPPNINTAVHVKELMKIENVQFYPKNYDHNFQAEMHKYSFPAEMYVCYKYTDGVTYDFEYSISAGVPHDSLILYKSVTYSGRKVTMPLELIEFIDLPYLLLVP